MLASAPPPSSAYTSAATNCHVDNSVVVSYIVVVVCLLLGSRPFNICPSFESQMRVEAKKSVAPWPALLLPLLLLMLPLRLGHARWDCPGLFVGCWGEL